MNTNSNNEEGVIEKWRLAMLVYPHLLPETARHRLYLAIREDEELWRRLQQTHGFNPRKREYTPEQVSLICSYLGVSVANSR